MLADDSFLAIKYWYSGYWDGNSFIPIDFSLHRERGNKLDKARKQANKARQKAKQSAKAYQEHKQKHHEERIKLNQLKSLLAEGDKTIRINLEQQERKVARSKKKQSILLRSVCKKTFNLNAGNSCTLKIVMNKCV